jgi:hypothetical protein
MTKINGGVLPMEVKGTAVIPIIHFAKDKFGSKSEEWMKSLSDKSADILSSVLSSGWYPMDEAMIEPTQKICDLFYSGNPAGAQELGKYSADFGLKGAYKLFVKFGSPSFIVARASQILPAYYKNSAMKVVEEKKNGSVIQVTSFPDMHRLVELRISGWMERALEICGSKDINIDITRSITRGDTVTEYNIRWN